MFLLKEPVTFQLRQLVTNPREPTAVFHVSLLPVAVLQAHTSNSDIHWYGNYFLEMVDFRLPHQLVCQFVSRKKNKQGLIQGFMLGDS